MEEICCTSKSETVKSSVVLITIFAVWKRRRRILDVDRPEDAKDRRGKNTRRWKTILLAFVVKKEKTHRNYGRASVEKSRLGKG